MGGLIDTHACWYPPAYLAAFDDTPGVQDSRMPTDFIALAPSAIELDHRLGLMDDAAVAVQA
jgi:hypothetical protein